MSGLAIITEACIDVKDRACVDVCPANKSHDHTFFIQLSRDVLPTRPRSALGSW